MCCEGASSIQSVGRAFEKSGRRHLAHTCGPNCGISWVGRVDATFVWPSAGEHWWRCGSPWRAEEKLSDSRPAAPRPVLAHAIRAFRSRAL